MKYAAKDVCTKMASPTSGRLEEVEESRPVSERSRENDVEDGTVEKQG